MSDTVILFFHSDSQNCTVSNASLSACKRGFAPGESLARWQTSLFPSNLRLITHVAKRMDSWAAAFVFQMALGVMGAELPALGNSRMERQDMCILGSQRSASRWCTRFFSRLPDANVGCYHRQYSYQNVFNFSQIICMSTCWITHPGRSWISLVQSCEHSTFSFVSSTVRLQPCSWAEAVLTSKGAWQKVTEIREKKAELPDQRQSQPPVCAISTARNVERKETPWRYPKPDCRWHRGSSCRGSCWIWVSPENPHKSSPPNYCPAIIPEEQSKLCFQGGLTSSIHLQGRGKQAAIPWLHSSSPLPPSWFPVDSAAVSSSIIQIKWFSRNLSGAPALLQGTDQQWAQLSLRALVHPCLAPNPKGVIPHHQKGCLESLAAHSARKSAIPTLLKGE